MKLIGAGLHNGVDLTACLRPEFGGIVCALNAKFLERVDNRLHRVRPVLHLFGHEAIDEKLVRRLALAVHAERGPGRARAILTGHGPAGALGRPRH